ncbi:MAG TPA: response regulator [Labilithrix sp.]|nr:response regulator [Labilithrix sp.]
MRAAWNVLVVDDEDDIHQVTRLALKRKNWRGRSVALSHAKSAAEARELLMAKGSPHFHVALVDVVMETDDAGLRLCDFIRSNITRSTRIVLRTGQPGVAPPEQVLTDYDIDYYLAKTEVTDQRLFLVLRSCFRSSTDIATILQVGAHMKALTVALQEAATTRERLAGIMVETLRFLEEKYGATIVFVHDVRNAPSVEGFARDALAAAVANASAAGLAPLELHPGAEVGLPSDAFLVMTTRLPAVDRKPESVGVGLRVKRWFQSIVTEQEHEEPVGMVVRFAEPLSARGQSEFLQDLDLFVSNWRVAESSWRLQDRLVRERMELVRDPRA